MAPLDHVLESVLLLSWLGVVATVAIGVLAWLYAAVFVGGSVLPMLLALVFIGFGTVIVLGTMRFYTPTLNPIKAFRRLLTFEWDESAHYHCDHCDRSYAQPAGLADLNCPYCGSPDPRPLSG